MDLVDESFVAEGVTDAADPEPEPTSDPASDDPQGETKPETADKEPTSASASEDDDDPEEYRELVRSKFPNLKTPSEVKAALAKSYRELSNASGSSRREQEALNSKIDRLEARLEEMGRKDERPEEEESPELQVITEEIQSLQDEGLRAVARIKEIESGWTKREREIGKLEVKLESADDLARADIRADLRDAQREHDGLIKERSEQQREVNRIRKQLQVKDIEFKRAQRGLEDERERQRQAEADRDARDEKTRESFDSHLSTLATTYKIPDQERKEFAATINARVVLDLKNRPVGPAISLRKLADHYAAQYNAHIDRMVKLRMREATRPTPPGSGTVTTRPAQGRPGTPSRPAPPRTRDEMLRAEEERKAKAREGMEEYFQKQARVKVS